MPRQIAKTLKDIEQKELEVSTKTVSERADGSPVVQEAKAEPKPQEDRLVDRPTKDLEIVMNKFNHYYVRWYGAQGGAPIPKILGGTWTRKDRLQEQIDRYFFERDLNKNKAQEQDGYSG